MDQSSQSSLSDPDDDIPLNEDEKDDEDEGIDEQIIFAPRDFDTTAMTKIRDNLLGVENRCKLQSIYFPCSDM